MGDPDDPSVPKIPKRWYVSEEQRRAIVGWHQIYISPRYIRAQWAKAYGRRCPPSASLIKSIVQNYEEYGEESFKESFRKPTELRIQRAAKKLAEENEKLRKEAELRESVRKALEENPSSNKYHLAALLKTQSKIIEHIAEVELGLTIDKVNPNRKYKPKPKIIKPTKPKPKPRPKAKPKKVKVVLKLKRTPRPKSRIHKSKQVPHPPVADSDGEIGDKEDEVQPTPIPPRPPVTVEDDPDLPNKIRKMLEEQPTLTSHYLAVLFKTTSEIVQEIVEKDLGMTINTTMPPQRLTRKRKRKTLPKVEFRRSIELGKKFADRARQKARQKKGAPAKIKLPMMTPAQRKAQQAQAAQGNSEGTDKPKPRSRSKPKPKVPPPPPVPNTIIQDVVSSDWLQESLRKLFPPKEQQQPEPVPDPVQKSKKKKTKEPIPPPPPPPPKVVRDPINDPQDFVRSYKYRYLPFLRKKDKKSHDRRRLAKLENMKELLKKNSTVGVGGSTRTPMAEMTVEDEYYIPQKKRRIAHVRKYPLPGAAGGHSEAKKQKNKSQPSQPTEFNMDNLEELDLEGCEVYELVEQEDGEPIFVLQQEGVQIQSPSKGRNDGRQQIMNNSSDDDEDDVLLDL